MSVYIISPVIVFALWFLNQRTDSGRPDLTDAVLTRSVCLGARLFGAGAIIGAVVFFASPQTMRMSRPSWNFATAVPV